MPCSPSDNTLNPTVSPGIPIPGFGLPFSPIQIPLPDFDLPTDLLEDLLALLERAKALFPGGLLKPNLDLGTKSILDAIAKMLNMLAPFLAFYNFIMALLNMIICIIEVLCAIPNPFAVASKLKKLFTECLPPFLALFPFLALIAMIIALLLLILALIEYIIRTIIAIIEAIIKNLTILADGLTLQDAESTLAAAQKIASLLCFIQNLLAILVAIAAILAIIQALSLFAGGAICDDNDPDGCCAPDICPAFIKNNDDGIQVPLGQMVYTRQIGTDVASILSLPANIAALFNLPPVREERWQLISQSPNALYPISSIITPILGNIFWPDPLVFAADTQPKKAPYTVDMRVRLNPITFIPTDGYGERFFRITDCIVVRKPYLGLLTFNNGVNLSNLSGTLNVEGGLVFEDDGTPYMVNGVQATLNTFIHQADSQASSPPVVDDSITFNSVDFTWKPNHPTLAGYSLTTVGCIPEVNIEKATQNAIAAAEGLANVATKLPQAPAGKVVPSTGILPNVLGAQQCVTDALAIFRKDVSNVGAATFQAAMETCLGDLRDQTSAVICNAIIAAVSQFKSTMVLDTDVQFTTRPIKLSVELRDGAGTLLSGDLPTDCIGNLEDKLKGEVTFGKVSSFIYDGSQFFDALITSKEAGLGEVTVSFDNKIFNIVIVGTVDVPSSIEENILDYQFIDGTVESPVRRDATDVAREGE